MPQSVHESNQALNSKPFPQIVIWVLLCVTLGLSCLAWWRSQSLLTEIATLRADQANWKDEAERLRASMAVAEASIRKGVEDEEKRSNTVAQETDESHAEKGEETVAEEALARLNFHIRSGASECKVDERCMVMEDVRQGAWAF